MSDLHIFAPASYDVAGIQRWDDGMGNLKVGDVVARKSYGGDILFEVVRIRRTGGEETVTLKGITCRLEADAPASDLVVQSDQHTSEYVREQMHFGESRHGSVGIAGHRRM